MAIMIGHFLCFKLVSYGLIVAWKIPYFCAAAFPVLTDTGVWWMVYTLVGVGVPLAAQYTWRKLNRAFVVVCLLELFVCFAMDSFIAAC